MITLNGYQDLIPIHDSVNSQVYRALRVSDGQSVILKYLNQEYPTPEQIRRYKQEYHLTCQLDSPGVIKVYQLAEWQRSYVIVLEDFGGISLRQWLQDKRKFSLEEFLRIAIATTESLGQIHAQNIIHKDINPANIVIHPETQKLKIIDFGISTQLSRENPTLKNPNILEGTLAYLSPEQTGRMNRELDYRTDFYSLGVTFYELLTGQLPFQSEDPLELVHCHIAKMPLPVNNYQLSVINDEGTGNREQGTENREMIPEILSDLVLKLMAKNAEDRYQSAWGIKADLEHCLTQRLKTETIEPFLLGTQDISDRFQIPQKLYGREKEIAALLAAFGRVNDTEKTELMLVAGYSGIGKSALVQELYKPITASRGYFISGKFDQFQRNIPYFAIVAAFRGLIEQILGESETQLQNWREKLLQALGNNGQIIIDVIPEVELIIGKQPPVPMLGANEAQNRFNLTIGNFIHVFCQKDHPLTLFLDDLQWADSATLSLIEKLLTDGQTQSLLLLGAYRDNEVAVGHPLTLTLEKLQKNQAVIHEIKLETLSLEQIGDLVSDTLKLPTDGVKNLSKLIQEKTGGNPFFINEFLQALYAENLLTFHPQERNWQWDIEAIASRNFTDNVVELMVEKLEQLPKGDRKILSLAACLGSEFDLTTLTWIVERSPQEVFEGLKIAMDRHFILTRSELDENLLIQSYKFAHDRIQQAAYALIPEAEKAEQNLAIGRILLAKIPPNHREEKLFEIVDRLDRGLALITDAQERETLAHLNLQAGRKAREANAYEAAIAYCDAGISLLDEQSWQTQYELTLNLYQEAAKANYLNANIERMEALIEIVFREAKTPRDLLELGKIKVDAYTNQGRPIEALTVGLESLAAVNIEFPQNPSYADVIAALEQTKSLIGDRTPADLANLPQMQDPLLCEILALLVKLCPVTYLSNPVFLSLFIFKQIELLITYGNAPISACSYAGYGTILCGIGELNVGYEYGQLALRTLSQVEGKQFETAVSTMSYLFTYHWKNHLRDNVKFLQYTFQTGLETGEFAYGGYASVACCIHIYLTSAELANTKQELEKNCHILEAIGQQSALIYCQSYLQVVANLQGQSSQPHCLVGQEIDENALISYYRSINDGFGLFLIYVAKTNLGYLFEKFDDALAASMSVQQYLVYAMSHPLIPFYYFYDSLIKLAIEPKKEDQTKEIGESNLEVVQANQEKIKFWADSAPMNYLHKLYLVEAEYHRVLGNKTEAMDYYDRAISGAKENEYIQEEALANELAAKFYLDWGKEKFARLYMIEARYCYQRWGATAKVQHLEEKYPQLCQFSKNNTTNLSDTLSNSDSTGTEQLDLATVIKATNAISSEIVLENLLGTLMDILVENAGAQRGILILPRSENLFVEATKENDSQEVSLLQSLPLDQFSRIPQKIVYYVARTRETVVLDHAIAAGNFTDDPYVQQERCQSIACTPLITQNKLQGIIYLENNLSTGAFTKERMELLRTLATQGAISLENARLYDACQRFVPEQFLSLLEKQSLVDVELGDQVEREMTVLFSDIRDFTTMSEQMTPADNFAFINEYLGVMETHIQANGGFIDKYIGDAIMALFDHSADNAVQGAIAMLEELKQYNLSRQAKNLTPIRIGIGLHTGQLMLGTVGGISRMDGTAIGDAVNLSSRVEGLTKLYGVSLLITHKTLASLNNPLDYDLRFIEQVKAKGKAKAVGLFEVFSADTPKLKEAKLATKEKFEMAVILYHRHSFAEAASLFQDCVESCQEDKAARTYLERCNLKQN